ncbi:MAG: glutathione S-transferase family protein [Candidatus Thiodiazotropha sp. (ex Notomyrtea botanica)]|nr:glutathione S-transferase family protein [Candidatus Thiodiazotropha sp. (ex Notomyrtea botanica)]
MTSPTILYDKAECPFCWRVRMALHRCQVVYERRDFEVYEQEWARLTPGATVPVFRLHGLVMHDSSVMLEYLNDAFGGLWPVSAEKRAQARTSAIYADTSVGRPVRDLVFQRRDRAPSEWDEAVIANAMQQWHEAMSYLDNALGDRDFFIEGVGITDFILASRFGLALAYGMPSPRSSMLSGWFERMAGRPEFTDTAPEIVKGKLDRGWLS